MPTLDIRRAPTRLRTDYFKTRTRDLSEITDVLIKYGPTIPDPRIDANFFDAVLPSKGYFGVPFHYVVKMDSTVEVARDPLTTSTVGHRIHVPHNLTIGVVGGLDEETGARIDTLTDAQREAIEELLQRLADFLCKPLEVTDLTAGWAQGSNTAQSKLDAQEAAEAAHEEALAAAEALFQQQPQHHT